MRVSELLRRPILKKKKKPVLKRRGRIKPTKRPSKDYVNYWRVVDGAVRDAFNQHPEYLTYEGAMFASARRSVVKRVTGALMSFAEAKRRTGVHRQPDLDASD